MDLGQITEANQLKARVLQGEDIYDTTGAANVTDEIVRVQQTLSPLVPSDVPILRCVGLNYAKHRPRRTHRDAAHRPDDQADYE
ncbi:uncharacterized protein BO66DRAFT_440042 [Aspergillus aculeatinus CBS 121060]|uniref:Uncharacterized protein n=1 Tax=Aspergillus aculeatinus CBS 121060 TaxID=1448322 RepID=A0ACD1H478_9EURO|nr:hypothetical protein BO66DRAFT_440042 [Aspergillus aculeatinus CBS 121060]RAH68426.1 hypothetical protein BO66DRAFT_440042 [Aspergillus aculeatinus CBS 121060]